jgi:hypothetical protein
MENGFKKNHLQKSVIFHGIVEIAGIRAYCTQHCTLCAMKLGVQNAEEPESCEPPTENTTSGMTQ